jgi:hypothetical protein
MVAGGFLHRRPATQIEVASRHRACAACRGSALQHQHACARGGGADGRAAACDTEADHHDIDVVGPRRHLGNVDGFRDLTAHRCSCVT